MAALSLHLTSPSPLPSAPLAGAAPDATDVLTADAFGSQATFVSERLRCLIQAVETLHACQCVHVSTAFVHEMVEDSTLWKGQVESFTLMGHPTAEEAFAWSWEDDSGETQCIAVLATPPILTPHAAVRAVTLGEPAKSLWRCTAAMESVPDLAS